jgi:predicted nucleic acid-binding Zn ribbon protein
MSDERKCEKCGDRLRVVSSHQYGATQLRYLKCRKCGNQCRRAVSADRVFRRTVR